MITAAPTASIPMAPMTPAAAAGGHFAGSSGGAAPAFSSLFASLAQRTQALDAQASTSVAGWMNGQGGEIHDTLIATQKASLTFELALQVRNKAIAAYQQMAGMQF
jgi:flagellar hook-basal body complex protein FliE